ncbi:hypothetical protein [Armatimonas sp.]|uniref:hypothetical protein n=1 Tax=Armatimonas sp. TaxID=1872638 RepID=UPI003751C355
MKTRRFIIALTVFSAMLFALSGCSGGGSISAEAGLSGGLSSGSGSTSTTSSATAR